jgi:hypothetical protein
VATPRVYHHSPENVHWLHASLAMALALGQHGGARFIGIGTAAEYAPSDRPCAEDETLVRPA